MEFELPKDKPYTILINRIEELIKGSKYDRKVFVVGGAIRDMVLHKTPSNLDLFVNLQNEDMKFCDFIAQKSNSFSTNNPSMSNWADGGRFYDIPILNLLDNEAYKHISIRVVSLTKLTKTILEDAYQRDFTMNSLYYNITNHKLYDVTKKGMEAIRNGVVECFEDPEELITTNSIVGLRAIRFAAQLGWRIEKNLWLTILNYTKEIKDEDNKLMAYEFGKILTSPNASYGMNKLRYSGYIQHIVPELLDLIGLEQGKKCSKDVWGHTLNVLDAVPRSLVMRYSALFHDLGKPSTKRIGAIEGNVYFVGHQYKSASMADEILLRLGYSKASRDLIKLIIRSHNLFDTCFRSNPSARSVKEFMNLFENERYMQYALDFIEANNKCHNPQFQQPNLVVNIKRQIERIKNKVVEVERIANEPKLPINGKDIMGAFKLKSSPLIGKLLDKIKTAFSNSSVSTKEECLELAKKEIEKAQGI